MTAVKILFVCEKWAECDPSHGLSNAHHNFIGSFRATELGTCQSFFYDEHVATHGSRCDAALLERAERFRPNMVFATPVRGTDINPLTDTLSDIRAKTAARIVVLNGDTYDDDAIAWTESFAAVADLVVIQDCYSYYPSRVRNPRKYFDAWTPQDPTLYFANGGERSVDVSFIGSVARYPDRKRALGVLAAAGIDVIQGGGQAEGSLSMDDYAATLRRSKIVLNFARPVFESPMFQCKGRTIEATLSGALLFEQANPETARWLTPGQHYVSFGDERDLVTKVRNYLFNASERIALAEAGRAHSEKNLSADAYWRRILSALDPRWGER